MGTWSKRKSLSPSARKPRRGPAKIVKSDARLVDAEQEFTGQTGLTPRQFGVLLTLFQQGRMTQTELSSRIHIDRSTLGGILGTIFLDLIFNGKWEPAKP